MGAPPNPMVGAVIVYDDRIIGEGYHRKCGEAHAEVNAVNSVADKSLLRNATIYVSLEPCAHYGKTPPCAELIVRMGFKRVVVGCIDPFAKVKGKGIEIIRNAGIEVTVGVLEDECTRLNRVFFTYHSSFRPYVTLKWAQSADGFIGKRGERTSISNPFTFFVSHTRRAVNQAIIVGRITALNDNPSLTTRLCCGPDPLRVVVDRNCSLPCGLALFDGSSPTVVFTDLSSVAEDSAPAYDAVEVEAIDFSADIVPQILESLYRRGVQSLLVEGGSCLLQSFIDCGLWDEAFVETSDVCLGEGVKCPILKNHTLVEKNVYLGSQITHFCLNHTK